MVSKKRLKPPKARKKNKKIKVHGLMIKDDYSWLRDDNWQEVLRKPSVLKPNIKKFPVSYTHLTLQTNREV